MHTPDTNRSTDQTDFTVRPLRVEDAQALSTLLLAQPPEYTRFFHAFSFAADQIAKMLAERGQDIYMGLLWQDELAGFFMLRGWNEGYDVPTLGTFVAEKYRGYGFMQLTVELTKVICKLRGTSRVMYKSHPDNAPAKKAAVMGFTQAGVDPATGNLIYHLDL
ncbi:MAG: GNAT family N-acetyltransferase [Acidobacteria bacterium]|nr:GNAT family N-acetyltransferase [Acidobacteriota bacterium]